jgi:hypothetical protein
MSANQRQSDVAMTAPVVDRHLLVVLGGGDLGEREIVAHWATCLASVA